MGQWDQIITYTFIASILCLLLPVIFSRDVLFAKEEEKEREEPESN
jgi:hypothetical protein